MKLIRIALAFLLLPSVASAQLVRPPDGTLYHVYPAGGQRGQSVAVELGGLSGLDGATGVIFDGPPGITVKDFKSLGVNKCQAMFVIAADAVPGPRFVRVVGGSNGLTSHRPFFVGTLPEFVEKEPNNEPQAAHEVTLPAVVNGRLDPALDTDCFAFQAKAGQRVVAGMHAANMDSRFRTRTAPGYTDTSLELLDSGGKILATASDTLGLDPVIEQVIPTDGKYTVRVTALGFEGSPSAVYRLTLGDVPFPATVFPAGAQRGKSVELEFTGFNVRDSGDPTPRPPPPRGEGEKAKSPSPLGGGVGEGSRTKFAAPQAGSPWSTVPFPHAQSDGRDLPFLLGDLPELIEAKANDIRDQAQPLPATGVTVNGRFDKPGDADWFRVTLKKGDGLLLEVAAQRHLRSPVDTVLTVFDAAGKPLAENDDGDVFSGQCEHDFPSSDSRLEFTAPADGDYFIRLTDQSGISGLRAVYRLTVEPLRPDFCLNQWPDAVPVWGPGSTASFLVQVRRWGGLKGDITLRVEGLPAGWKGSVGYAGVRNYYAPRHGLNQKAFLTITAPAAAKVGDVATFRVVGRVVEPNGMVIEREAWPQTLMGSSHTDRMHLRYSPVARAAVAPPLDSRIESSATELTVTQGETVMIPVKVTRAPDLKTPISISVDGEPIAAGSAWRIAYTLKPDENELLFPLTVTAERKPGTYGIVVSRGWAADIRAGRPGPCSELILLHVKEPAKK